MEHIYPQDALERLVAKMHGTVVLAGGCFDILHKGHEEFLNAARHQGDMLIILLESDVQIKKTKGPSRPIHPQMTRAINLIKTTAATDVVLLNDSLSDNDYDQIVTLLKPAIIATTENDPLKFHKDRQAKIVGSSVKEVVKRHEEYSTTKILEEL